MIEKEKYINKEEMSIIQSDISQQAKDICQKINDDSLFIKKDLTDKVFFMREEDNDGNE